MFRLATMQAVAR